MASSALQKLLRNQSSKIVAHIRQPQSSLHSFVPTQIPQIANPDDVLPSPDHPRTDSLKPNHSFCGQVVYPSFSFEFFLNAVAPPGLVRRETAEEVEADDSSVIRADSVKKKRKRKMNKHKLRKLRKRLQKKTKA